MARIIGIAFKVSERAPMQGLRWTSVSLEGGIEGDFRGRGGSSKKRQVTLLSLQQWQETCRRLGGVYLHWHTRRANILVDGLKFGPDDVGKIIRIGSVVLEVTGETKPCERMDEAYFGLKDALAPDWRAGVTCRVVESGQFQLSCSVDYVSLP